MSIFFLDFLLDFYVSIFFLYSSGILIIQYRIRVGTCPSTARTRHILQTRPNFIELKNVKCKIFDACVGLLDNAYLLNDVCPPPTHTPVASFTHLVVLCVHTFFYTHPIDHSIPDFELVRAPPPHVPLIVNYVPVKGNQGIPLRFRLLLATLTPSF